MNQQIIDYLQQNKAIYTKESLVQQLRNSSYLENDIQEAVNMVFDTRNIANASQVSTRMLNNIAMPSKSSEKFKFVAKIVIILTFICSFLFVVTMINKKVPLNSETTNDLDEKNVITSKLQTVLTYKSEDYISEPDSDFIIFNGQKIAVFVTLNYKEKIVTENYKPDFEKHLMMWKQAFQKINKMDDEYFNKHIFIKRAEINLSDDINDAGEKSDLENRFYVDFYWKVDWVSSPNIRDYFTFSIDGVDHNITLDKILLSEKKGPIDNSDIESNQFFFKTAISNVKLISKVATQDQIENAIRKVIPVDAQYEVKIYRVYDEVDDLVFDVIGTVNEKRNECIQANFSIETADLLFVKNIECLEIWK